MDVSPTCKRDQPYRLTAPKIIYLGQKYCVDMWAVLEMLQNPHSLHLTRAPVNVQLLQLLCVSLLQVKSTQEEEEKRSISPPEHIHCQKRQ